MVFDKIAHVRPYAPNDYAELAQAARADSGHIAVAPTHVVEKEGRIVGYFSLGAIPLALVWLDTKACQVLDTVVVVSTYENLARAMGHQALCVPCSKTSPFYQYMKKNGFVEMSDMTMFVKSLL